MSDGVNYYAQTSGLHDAPTVEAVLSQGYQSEAVDVGVRATPRQYAYNSMGARTAMTDGIGTTLYNYDSLLRPTSLV